MAERSNIIRLRCASTLGKRKADSNTRPTDMRVQFRQFGEKYSLNIMLTDDDNRELFIQIGSVNFQKLKAFIDEQVKQADEINAKGITP